MPASALRPSGSSSGGRGRLAGLWEKSPARSRSVGTIPFRLTGSCRRTFSKSTKKNVLFFFRGPPREKPYWSRTWSGFSPELKKSRASKLAKNLTTYETNTVSHVVRFFAGVEEIPGIKIGPLPVPPATAVKIVRTLLQHHIHDRAAVVAELGGKAVVLNLKFLDDLDRRLVVDVGVAALALLRRADGTAIERNLGGGVALTVGDEVGAGRVVVEI